MFGVVKIQKNGNNEMVAETTIQGIPESLISIVERISTGGNRIFIPQLENVKIITDVAIVDYKERKALRVMAIGPKNQCSEEVKTLLFLTTKCFIRAFIDLLDACHTFEKTTTALANDTNMLYAED